MEFALLLAFVMKFCIAREVQLQPFSLTHLHILYHRLVMRVLYEKLNFVEKYWIIRCVHETSLLFFLYLLKR